MVDGAWLDEVKRALDHVRASDATEVEVARAGFRLHVRRRPGAARPTVAIEAPSESAPSGTPILAPLTGVFYRAASPTAAPYVSEGDLVQPDTVVGLIETMKIFNEVLAERRGRVREIVVQAGQLVQAGDRLMWIDEVPEGATGPVGP